MVGCAGETEGAIEKPSIPPYFQLSAHFSRIIDGSRDVQLSGMKMSQSLGSRGSKETAVWGSGGKNTRCSYCAQRMQKNEARARNVTAVNMLSLGGLPLRTCIWFVYHQGQCSCIHAPPPTPPSR